MTGYTVRRSHRPENEHPEVRAAEARNITGICGTPSLPGNIWRGELINRRKDGTFYTEKMTITPVRDPDNAISNYIAIKEDVTDRRAAEEALTDQEHEAAKASGGNRADLQACSAWASRLWIASIAYSASMNVWPR